MYGPELSNFLRTLASLAQQEALPRSLLDDSLSAYLQAFAERTLGTSEPLVSFSELTTRLVLLSDVLVRERNAGPEPHYLVAMCLEQAGFISATGPALQEALPFDDDDFLRLVLANLHYLAGEYRAHAAASLERLNTLAGASTAHGQVVSSLRRLLRRGRIEEGLVQLGFGGTERIRTHLNHLVGAIGQRQGGLADQLGVGSSDWLAERGIADQSAIALWGEFVSNLEASGISSLTHDQYGDGGWISLNRDILVDFPTGSGKTVIGYVRTALSVVAGFSALWILPTRALVRQVLRGLRRTFRGMNAQVQEVPTTEDPGALFSDAWDVERPVVAATTPERALALLRSNPAALKRVGVLVMDEAQILCDENRGVAAEQLVGGMKAQSSTLRFVMMTGFSEAIPVLRAIGRALSLDTAELVSVVRPSRRVYAVLRATETELEAVVYPPRPSGGEPGSTSTFVLRFPDRRHRAPRQASETARRFVARTHAGGLRSVIFVRNKESAESQAERTGSVTSYQLTSDERARLRLELGRASVIESTVRRSSAPHHGGLSSLEQHVIERLLSRGTIISVFATPTLAQGVNLPLDLSVVTFTDRRDTDTEVAEDLSESEVQNMLGRAGRAGLVPDGFCVLVRKESRRPRVQVLEDNRRWFFAQRQPNAAGVVTLLRRVASIAAGSVDWLSTLAGVEFSEAQSILAMLAATVESDATLASLERFPSVRALTPTERADLIRAAESIALQLVAIGERDRQTLRIIARTGLPPSFVSHILTSVQSPAASLGDTDWWDDVIHSFLTQNAEIEWVRKLSGTLPPTSLVAFVKLWRSGAQRSQLEAQWPRVSRPRLVRINVGSYLNQRMSLVAQLWGVAASLAEVFELEASGLRQLGACVREGVPSSAALIWLRAVGGLDRVLATLLDQQLVLDEGPYYQRIQSAEATLRNVIDTPPVDINSTLLAALRAAIDEN